jgi:copper chaperone CopZ
MLTREGYRRGWMMSVRATYTVVGMTCDHCVRSVGDELRKVPGVRAVEVDLATGAVDVTSDGPLPVERVASAVDEAGYTLAGTPT